MPYYTYYTYFTYGICDLSSYAMLYLLYLLYLWDLYHMLLCTHKCPSGAIGSYLEVAGAIWSRAQSRQTDRRFDRLVAAHVEGQVCYVEHT